MYSTFRMVVIPPEATGYIHARIVDEAVRWCIIENGIKKCMGIVNYGLDLFKLLEQW